MTESRIRDAVLGYKLVFSRRPSEITMHPLDWKELSGTESAGTWGDMKVFLDPEFPLDQVVCWG